MSTKQSETPSQVLMACLREHEALYRLVEFRLVALDRRIPLIGGVLTGFLSLVPLMPIKSQLLGLIALPVSLIWLVRTTINHAQSFEDVLRAIEKLEQRINTELGQDVLGFQRTHPSRGVVVGGRTGSETVMAVTLASCLLLGMSLWIGLSLSELPEAIRITYPVLVGAIAIANAISIRSWKMYKYLIPNCSTATTD